MRINNVELRQLSIETNDVTPKRDKRLIKPARVGSAGSMRGSLFEISHDRPDQAARETPPIGRLHQQTLLDPV